MKTETVFIYFMARHACKWNIGMDDRFTMKIFNKNISDID